MYMMLHLAFVSHKYETRAKFNIKYWLVDEFYVYSYWTWLFSLITHGPTGVHI